VPPYISGGLSWMQSQLERKQKDVLQTALSDVKE
jgi:hypothetical protein